jgi:hypothetical protein
MHLFTCGSYKMQNFRIMGNRSIIILMLTVLMGGSYFVRAQPNTLYFMKGIPQSKDLNPARPGISGGYYFSMPLFSKLDLAANTNNWSYNDLIHQGTGEKSDSLILDFNNFRESLSNNNFVFESAALTVFEGGYKKGKNFYAISLTEREFAEVFFKKGLIDLISFGNSPYIGRTFFSGNFGISAQHYRELAFNYSHELNKKITVGTTAKILFGMSAIHTSGLNFRGFSPSNGDYLDISASGRVNISAPVDFTYNSNNYIQSSYSLPNFSAGDYLTNMKNRGIAVDLGFTYRLNKKTELSASIIDLGVIGWKTNVTRLTEHGFFPYHGVQLNDPINTPPVIDQFKPAIDSLNNAIAAAFRLDTTGVSFATLLPVKIYFGVDYKLNRTLNVSGLTRIRISNNQIHTSLTASANALLGDVFSLSASYSIMESTFDNLGLGIGIKAGAFQIYTAADNLFSPFYPSKARNMNLRIGINFVFNHSDTKSSGRDGSSEYPNCQCPK